MPPQRALTDEKKIQDTFLNIILLILFIVVFLIFRPYLPIMLLAFTLTVIFRPVFFWIHNHTGRHEVLSAILTTILILLIVLLPLAFFSVLMFNELNGLLSSPNQVLLHISNFQLPGILQKLNIDIISYLKTVTGGFVNDIGTIFSNVASFFIYIVLTIITLIYFFKDGVRIRSALFRMLPFTKEQGDKLDTDLTAGVRAIIGGYILVAIIQGVASSIGFTIFGIPNPALWGFLVFFCALLPAFGSMLINIPMVVYLFINHHTGGAIGFLVWYLVSLGIIDNYIGPRFISGRIDIHPLLVIFSLIGGLSFFGAIGFIIGPLVLILFWSILGMFRQREEVTEAAAMDEQKISA